jgi:diketogulonate reductase-like aldo/keto reductase
MLSRPIPSSGELLPVVGLGTWQQFDVGAADRERQPLRDVLDIMVQRGARVIDSSPMYGRSEQVVGDLTNEPGLNADLFFYATKVWTTGRQAGIGQMDDSLRKMRRRTMDLLQIHNLVDWTTHIATLRDWKAAGRIRYIGITHYTDAAHEKLEQIIRSEPIDFVQCNFSIADRHAERSLLPTARDRGVAVLINEPFQQGKLFAAVRDRKLPEWAADYGIRSWAQYFLKYILSHPAVTCVIPGTSNPKHLVDNLDAALGQMPDEKTRQKMISF